MSASLVVDHEGGCALESSEKCRMKRGACKRWFARADAVIRFSMAQRRLAVNCEVKQASYSSSNSGSTAVVSPGSAVASSPVEVTVKPAVGILGHVGNPGVNLAEKACLTAWRETAKQTKIILFAATVKDGMEAMKVVIQAAGAAIQTKVQTELNGGAPVYASSGGSSGTSSGSSTIERSDLRRNQEVLMNFDHLGESDNDTGEALNRSDQMQKLGSMVGKSMWEEVQKFCEKLGKIAPQGEEAVKSAAQVELAGFVACASATLAASPLQ